VSGLQNFAMCWHSRSSADGILVGRMSAASRPDMPPPRQERLELPRAVKQDQAARDAGAKATVRRAPRRSAPGAQL